jgi:tetratricopeptide (TPR) repeat protein
MGLLTRTALALAALAIGSGGGALAADAGAAAKVSGSVVNEPAVVDGVVWTTLSSYSNADFLIDTKDAGQRTKAVALLNRARREGRRVVIVFDPSSGAVDLSAPVAYFRVLELDYDEARLAIDGAPTGAAPQGASGPAAKAVARGLGRKYSGDWDGAEAELKAALGDAALSPSLRAIAYRTLGEMAQARAENDFRLGSPESDQLLMDALSDFKSEQVQTPESSGPKIEIAWVLVDLGAYDEALAIYRDLAAHDRRQAFWADIAVSYVHRARGEYDDSLKALDEVASKHGRDSMPYHYHRGLTLLRMGRDAEAVEEFTTGLKFQPDYGWAKMGRACAYGRMGRLKEALADVRGGSVLEAQEINQKLFARDYYERARAATIAEQLSTAISAGAPAKIDSACKEAWPNGFTGRSRSPLLPKA